MKLKAIIVVMSHLSDAQESMNPNSNEDINFAKYIILQCEGNLNQEIDPDAMYDKFINLLKLQKKQVSQ